MVLEFYQERKIYVKNEETWLVTSKELIDQCISVGNYFCGLLWEYHIGLVTFTCYTQWREKYVFHRMKSIIKKSSRTVHLLEIEATCEAYTCTSHLWNNFEGNGGEKSTPSMSCNLQGEAGNLRGYIFNFLIFFLMLTLCSSNLFFFSFLKHR